MDISLTVVSPLRPDDDGVVRVGNSRVTLQNIIHAYQRGSSPEAIVQSYPALTLADVYYALAYYLDNPAEVETYLHDEAERAESIRNEIRSKQNDQNLKQRLLERLDRK